MSPPQSARYELLDAFRGIAILAVILLHFASHAQNSGDQFIHAHIWPILSHGYLGVDLFFVLSGYCITAAMLGASEKQRPLQYFLLRRARRIFPPYWWSIVLVVLLGAATCCMTIRKWHAIFPLSLGDWALNLVLMQELFHAPKASVVYWSLSIEIQFYLVMALCLLRSQWTDLFLIAITVISLFSSALAPYAVGGTILVFWPEFACGIAVCYLVTHRNRFSGTPWVLLGSAVVTALVLWQQQSPLNRHDNHISFAVKIIFTICCAALLWILYPYDARLAKTFVGRTLSLLGVISYTLYLCHEPIGTRFLNLAARMDGMQGLKWLPCVCAAVAFTLAFGSLYYRYCERPWISTASTRP